MRKLLTKRLALLLSGVFLLSACQGGGGKTTPQIVVMNNTHETGGTDNTGGGNGLQGKPLDAYIEKDISKLAPYKNRITPLIKILEKDYPRLAADFYHISLQRDWYFLPAELDQISKNILGTYAKTDQIALQDLNKIWVDLNLFSKMTEQDQATLILHEIMMGIKLMKFKSRQDQCIAKAALLIFQGTDSTKYGEQKRSCRRTYPVLDGTSAQRFSLTPDDYDLIRKLVSLLDSQNPDVEEVKSLIETHSFRNHFD